MRDWKKIGKSILLLPLWLVFLFTMLSALALGAVFIGGWNTHPAAYAVYAFSFYTLTVLCIACVKTLPPVYKNTRKRLYDNAYANRYLTDAAYKTHVRLYLSLGVNLLYVATNAVSAVVYHTLWFAIFAIYYAIMAAMHFLLVRYVGKNGIGENRLGEWRRSRACAFLLMNVNIVLSGVVLMMVYYDRGFQYQGYLIYVMAVYTFYTTAAAIKDVITYRKYQSPVMSMSRVIKLTASLFSMLFLETAMFAQFGQDSSEERKRIMIMVTGAGICVIVVGMSVSMIVRCTGAIRQNRQEMAEMEKKEKVQGELETVTKQGEGK